MAQFIVGLTGGIGSGKSEVSRRFEKLGVCVVDADVVARAVVEPGSSALEQIASHFGRDILQADGSLNRRELRARVFANPDAKQWLEDLLHPLIHQETLRQLDEARSPYAILVSPLLFEAQQQRLVGRTLLVDSEESEQIGRTMVRDHNSREQVEAILKTQMSREQKQQLADDVLLNDGSLEELDRKVALFHQQYLALAKGEQ